MFPRWFESAQLQPRRKSFPSQLCHSELSRSERDGGVEEPAVCLRHHHSRVEDEREGHGLSRAAKPSQINTGFSR